MNVEEMKSKIASISSTQDLVDAYVESDYQYGYYEDAEYDFEEGTEEYEAACAETDASGEIVDDLERRIMKAALEEGLLDEGGSGTFHQIEPFMDKYGYMNRSWWVKKES